MGISSDADIDCYDKAMLTPLHEAASSGKGSIIKLLLKNGANVVLTDKSNKTSLKASTSNEIHHPALQPNKQHKHPKSANSVSAINLSSKSKKHSHAKKKNGHRHTTETEKMRTAITQLNLFGNEVNESNAILQQLKSTNFGLNERI